MPLFVLPDGTPELATLGALGDTATGSPAPGPRVKLSPLRNGSRLTAPPPARTRLYAQAGSIHRQTRQATRLGHAHYGPTRFAGRRRWVNPPK